MFGGLRFGELAEKNQTGVGNTALSCDIPVAVNICQGVQGYIHTDTGDFLIQPEHQHHHPHMQDSTHCTPVLT